MKIVMGRENRSVIISIRDQIEESNKMFGEDIDDKVASPANRNLFTTYDGESDELGEPKSDFFHSVTAKLLFIMKRARSDIETTISYLVTRVSKSNEKDWEKLRRCLGFLKGSIGDKRIIDVDSLQLLRI